ncbi:MAG: LysR family transcriptional regulator [Myxococcales bacterium]|nr:LysR family transcriptional regulator [Myxococcales bacterium]
MHVTLEQARTLDAFARAGTLQAAARALRKAHSAVLYALKHLESQAGLSLFDRTGYRTRLTPAGEEVLRHCQRLLEAEAALTAACEELRSGWEPVLRVVFDAVVPLGPVLEVVRALKEAKAPTRVQLSVDSLGGVEERFEAEHAQVMISVLPPRLQGLTATALPAFKARLVAHKTHPLARLKRALTREDLCAHVLLTVRGSDPRLQLPTAQLEAQSAVHLSDFHAKKAAVVAGLGFGWLPDWLIEEELAKGEVLALKLPRGSVHTFAPRLLHRGSPGPAARKLVALLAR